MASLDQLFSALSNAARTEIMRETARVVGGKAEELLPEYPTPSGKPLPLIYNLNGKPSKFKSDKQRRKVMALARAGLIPYRRTGTLGKSIQSAVQGAEASSARIEVGTNIDYAPYVIGRGSQAPYHQGHWWTLEGELEKQADELGAIAGRAFAEAVIRRLAP